MSDQQPQNTGDTQNPNPNSQTDAAAAAAAATGGAPAAGAEGDKPWYDGFQPELKSWTGLAKYKGPEDLALALKSAEGRLGVPADQLVRLPKTPDDKEGLAAVFKALGAPDTPEGYQFTLPENLAETDKAAVQSFAKHMHEATMAPPSVLSAAVEWWTGEVARQEEAATAELAQLRTAGETKLKEAWGAAFDQRKTEVGALITELGGEDLAKELNASTLGDHPALAMALAKVVDMRAEPGPAGDGQRAVPAGRQMTPDQARAARLEMEADPVKMAALMDAAHPQHTAVVEQRNRLLAAVNGRAA